MADSEDSKRKHKHKRHDGDRHDKKDKKSDRTESRDRKRDRSEDRDDRSRKERRHRDDRDRKKEDRDGRRDDKRDDRRSDKRDSKKEHKRDDKKEDKRDDKHDDKRDKKRDKKHERTESIDDKKEERKVEEDRKKKLLEQWKSSLQETDLAPLVAPVPIASPESVVSASVESSPPAAPSNDTVMTEAKFDLPIPSRLQNREGAEGEEEPLDESMSMAVEQEVDDKGEKEQQWLEADDDTNDAIDQPTDTATTTAALAEDEIDPLDAFMSTIVQEAAKQDTFVPKPRAMVSAPMQMPMRATATAFAAAPVVPSSHTNMEVDETETEETHTSTAEDANGNGTAMVVAKSKEQEKEMNRYFSEGDSDSMDEMGQEEDFFAKVAKKEAQANKKDLKAVDHSKVYYMPFRKDFYIETKEITNMTDEEVTEYRTQLGDIKVRGRRCPRPIKTWYQIGLNDRVLKVIEKRGYKTPFPIQCQSCPAIMSGRDVIGIAETGSGKTLAYVLPMIRHILDQPRLKSGEGPIGLIMAPTRELAVQIYNECNSFCKAVGLRVVCVYGGAGVQGQLSDLKRGAEIVVCTPGRMIDVLTTSSGKICNLLRVTYVVLDEADRMFDMGFEPQISRIIGNIRPDRQTVMFSATFPKHVEMLAKKILKKPVEIVVGTRGKACATVKQYVEVRGEGSKFLRLLELLGEWYERGSIIIFVDRQVEADTLFKDLLMKGYSPLVLHGGQDQTDRDFTISDFKNGIKNLLIATSIASRGLDVKNLNLVVNYRCPNHMEDYVHRVGRTGRAGREGTAYTFITPEEEEYAADLIKALEASGNEVPGELRALADNYQKKVNTGVVEQHKHGGFGGKGFKFDINEQNKANEERKRLKKAYGLEEEEEEEQDDVDLSDDEKETESGTVETGESKTAQTRAEQQVKQEQQAAGQAVAADMSADSILMKDEAKRLHALALATAAAKQEILNGGTQESAAAAAKRAVEQYTKSLAIGNAPPPATPEQGLKHAHKLIEQLNARQDAERRKLDEKEGIFRDELEINDYPQFARYKVTHKDTLTTVQDLSQTTITVRGSYIPPSEPHRPGHRKLYIHIEGPNKYSLQIARSELKRIVEEAAISSLTSDRPNPTTTARYTVVDKIRSLTNG
eukprot:GILK01006814.1.p1 GENE.GILK01006814.1~~GILK01006814.1.p1  ORF type:complete len:1135 (+),score=266.68 GILK01006814.1:28-3432(+)